MTDDTAIYIEDEIGPLDVFNYLIHQLVEFQEPDSNGPRTFDAVRTKAEVDTDWHTKKPLDTWTMETVIGQGMPAWLMVHYRPGGAYRTTEQAAEHDEDICNLPTSSWTDEDSEMCDGTDHAPACHLQVSMDTAYGFHGPNGMRCDHLHGVILARLTEWLGAQGVAWKWKNEYTGDIHPGGEGLDGLLKGGDEANAWFDNVASPVIAAHIASAEFGEA